MLETLVHPADATNHHHVVIALHGMNADRTAFLPFVRQLPLPRTRWILPTAPFGGSDADARRAWFDPRREDPAEIAFSRASIGELIDGSLAGGIAAENLFLLGFSQGAAMAIDTALRFPRRLGGLVALSGYIVLPADLERDRHPANARVPVFLAHGVRDAVLPPEHGRTTRATLQRWGYDVAYTEYDTGHRISTRETRDIRRFLFRHMHGYEEGGEGAHESGQIAPF